MPVAESAQTKMRRWHGSRNHSGAVGPPTTSVVQDGRSRNEVFVDVVCMYAWHGEVTPNTHGRTVHGVKLWRVARRTGLAADSVSVPGRAIATNHRSSSAAARLAPSCDL